MTVAQASKYIGKQGDFTVGKMSFPVEILDIKLVYGCVHVFVKPKHGLGEQWTTLDKVRGLQ